MIWKTGYKNHPSWIAKRKKNKNNEDKLRNLWDNIKHTKICIIGVPKREEIDKAGKKNVFEDVIVDNFDKLGKETVIQVQEAEWALSKMNPLK